MCPLVKGISATEHFRLINCAPGVSVLEIFKAGDLQASLKSHQATKPSCPTEQRIDGPKDPKLLSFLLFFPSPLPLGCTKSKSTILCLWALNRFTTCSVSGSKWQMSPYDVAAVRYSCPRDILRLRITSGTAEFAVGRLSWAKAKVLTKSMAIVLPGMCVEIILYKGKFHFILFHFIEILRILSLQLFQFQFYL